MEFGAWLAFALAAAIVLLIPAPAIVLVIAQSLTHGRRAALPQLADVVLGDPAMTGSLLRLGAILATSVLLFTTLKWLGAAYLVYLGIITNAQLTRVGPIEQRPIRCRMLI